MSKYSCNTSLLDILFNMLLAFAMLFIISFALVRKNNPENQADRKMVGDLLVTITWPSDRDDDIDMWVKDPEGNIVFFHDRQSGLMHLDRDDVGLLNDTISTEVGQSNRKSIGNQEVVTIRGLKDGEYIFNVHAYMIRAKGEVPVSLRIDRIGSPTRTVFVRTVKLKRTGHEITMVRMTFKNGKVVDVEKLFVSLFKQRSPNNYPQGPRRN